MENRNVKTIICIGFLLILLTSCCHTVDTRVPKGYPYGDWHELNWTLYKGCIYDYQKLFSNHYVFTYVDFVTDAATCDSLMARTDSSCNCNNIDFNKNILAKLYNGGLGNNTAFPRVIINHKEKKCIVEVRTYYKHCNLEAYQYEDSDYGVIMFPRPPSDYELSIVDY